MPFNLLVTSCFHQGTTFKDENDSPRIVLNVDSNREKIILFRIDEDGHMNTPFRIAYNMNDDGDKICDLLVYYKNLSSGEHFLVLTETKGKKFDDAANQIINTYKKMGLNNSLRHKKYCEDIDIRVCCVSKRLNKYTNTDAKQAKGKIINTINIDKNDCAFVDPYNFIRFLRGEKISTV